MYKNYIISDSSILWMHGRHISVLRIELHWNRRCDRDLIRNAGLCNNFSILSSWRENWNQFHSHCPYYFNWYWRYCSSPFPFRVSRVRSPEFGKFCIRTIYENLLSVLFVFLGNQSLLNFLKIDWSGSCIWLHVICHIYLCSFTMASSCPLLCRYFLLRILQCHRMSRVCCAGWSPRAP